MDRMSINVIGVPAFVLRFTPQYQDATFAEFHEIVNLNESSMC